MMEGNLVCPNCGSMKFEKEETWGVAPYVAEYRCYICNHPIQVRKSIPEYQTVILGPGDEVVE